MKEIQVYLRTVSQLYVGGGLTQHRRIIVIPLRTDLLLYGDEKE